MPPTSPDPRETIRWLTRLLGALIQDSPKKELRVRLKTLKQLAGEGARQAIFEDTDPRRQEIVLRFGGRESAVYTIESDLGTGTGASCQPAAALAAPEQQRQTTARPTSPQPPQTMVTRTPPPVPPQPRVGQTRAMTDGLPFTEDQLNRMDEQWAAAMEKRRQQTRAYQAIRRDRSDPNREPLP